MTDLGSLPNFSCLGVQSPPPSLSEVPSSITRGMATGPKLKFCPESNDLLYPKEDRERKVLIFHCRNCGYQEDADTSNYCVYRNEITHTSKEKTVILQDVRADPTLPRTRDVTCEACGHNEAVFFSASTEEGMTLFFNCTKCGHRWQDRI